MNIALANILLTRARPNTVQDFANTVISLQTQHLAELHMGAESFGICLPDRPSKDQETVIRYFRLADSCDLERDYLVFVTVANSIGITLADEELSTGQNALAKEFALRNKLLLQFYIPLAHTTAGALGDLCADAKSSP